MWIIRVIGLRASLSWLGAIFRENFHDNATKDTWRIRLHRFSAGRGPTTRWKTTSGSECFSLLTKHPQTRRIKSRRTPATRRRYAVRSDDVVTRSRRRRIIIIMARWHCVSSSSSFYSEANAGGRAVVPEKYFRWGGTLAKHTYVLIIKI